MKHAKRFLVSPNWKLFLQNMGIDPALALTHAQLPPDLFNRDGVSLSPQEYFRFWYGVEQATNAQEELPLLLAQHLRGFVTCGCCGGSMTGYWAKGRSAHYGYYMCFQKDCKDYRKSTRKEKVEAEFEGIVKDLKPSDALFKLSLKIFRDLWERRVSMRQQDGKAIEAEMRKVDKQVEQLLDRIMEAENGTLITAYEKKLEKLEQQKIILSEKFATSDATLPCFDKAFRTAFEFLKNPHKLWLSERLEDKRTLLKLAFADRLPYDRNDGFRTAPIAQPIRALGDFRGGLKDMARPAGFEPAAPGSGNQCSIP